MRHIVWDWNGTLFDDQHVVVEALAAVLRDQGLAPIDLATYQQLYTRPVQIFYERLFGRAIEADEWQRVDDVYHAGYRHALARAQLAVDAEVALQRAGAEGRTQSLLSMYRHEELVPLVSRLGIADRFTHIDGLRGEGGGRKAPYLRAHLDAVVRDQGIDPAEVLVVGDALDDAAAAAAAGVACILYDGGSHPRADLEATGVPVVDRLTAALDLVGSRPGPAGVALDGTVTPPP